MLLNNEYNCSITKDIVLLGGLQAMTREREYCSLYDIYLKALNYPDIHKCTEMKLSAFPIDTLFEDNNAQKFIKNYFGRANNRIDKNPQFRKLYHMIDSITKFRAKHTVASFLLGIAVKKELHLNTKNWIRLYSTKTSEESFGFFWSVICLLHDVGYHFEQNTKKHLQENRTAADFCEKQGVTYNLLLVSKKGKLMERYYAYRISGEASEDNKGKIDHGVAAGILIYDALMEIYHSAQKQNEDKLCGMRISKGFDEFALEIAETIALHNMWLATKETSAVYDIYQLKELIPGDSDLVIYYENEPLRFLLGLIDTIDPIKFFCNSEQDRKYNLPTERVINGFLMSTKYSSHQRALFMGFKDLRFMEYANKMKSQNKWLGIEVGMLDSGELKIQVKKIDGIREALAG